MTIDPRIQKRCGWTLGAAAMAALIAIPLAQAAAQAVPVQNTDEPGRNPYQETKFTKTNNFLNFSFVPANTRRVITHVNCSVLASVAHAIYNVVLYNGFFGQSEQLPAISTSSIPGGGLTIYAENPVFYLDSGDYPIVNVNTNDPAPHINCRLSGYDVNLAASVAPPQPPS